MCTSLLMIIGDSNARVGDLSEFSDDDNIGLGSLLQGNTRSCKISRRNYCDREIKQNGPSLVELCRTFHMQIANGRFFGDLWGNFTHHNISKGGSTVDLAIVFDTHFDYIEDFKVLPQKDFSDHCKIVITIKNAITKETIQTDNYKWISKEPEFKSNNNPSSFVNALKSLESMAAINQCNKLLEAGLIKPSYKIIHEIFISVAEKALEKKKEFSTIKRHKNKKNKIPKKWFDIECQVLKDKTKQTNLKHQNPWDKSLLQEHREILKHYKKVCTFKKYHFWKEEVTKLEQSLSCSQEFWETWGKVRENKTNSLVPEVSGKQWETHFKTLFKEHEGNIENLMHKIKISTKN